MPTSRKPIRKAVRKPSAKKPVKPAQRSPKKAAARRKAADPFAALPPGEYGFVSTRGGSPNAGSTIYDFGVV